MGPDAIAGLLGLFFSIVVTLFVVVVSVLAALASAALPIGILYFIYKAMEKQAAVRRRMQEVGIPAQALVLSLSETGLLINNQPQVRLQLQVLPPDGEAYEATLTQTISMLQAPRLQPGSTVAVLIDPDAPQHILLDLSHSVQAVRQCRYCHRRMGAEDASCASCGAAA